MSALPDLKFMCCFVLHFLFDVYVHQSIFVQLRNCCKSMVPSESPSPWGHMAQRLSSMLLGSPGCACQVRFEKDNIEKINKQSKMQDQRTYLHIIYLLYICYTLFIYTFQLAVQVILVGTAPWLRCLEKPLTSVRRFQLKRIKKFLGIQTARTYTTETGSKKCARAPSTCSCMLKNVITPPISWTSKKRKKGLPFVFVSVL